MEGTATVNAILKDLELTYDHEIVEEGVEHYDIVVDPEEDLRVSGVLYTTDDGPYFRVLCYVDELDKDHGEEQLTKLMVLNCDIPTGAFCLDPDEGVILVTVNMPLGDLNAEFLSWTIEFCLAAQDIYFEEYYPENGDELAMP